MGFTVFDDLRRTISNLIESPVRLPRFSWFPWGTTEHVIDHDDWAGVLRDPFDSANPGSRLDDSADERADQLLRDHLGVDYQLLASQGYLDVNSRLFKNTHYRLRLRRPIEVFKNGRRQPWRLCIVSIERVPAADELFMKLLWLKTNEEYVLATANRVR